MAFTAERLKVPAHATHHYAVLAETHAGKTMTLRGGFTSREAAEDHPVQLSLWKRVWVEETEPPTPPRATLPPLPWDWVASESASANGSFNAYLVDATGRKIAAIWGKGNEKAAIADFILSAVNETSHAGCDEAVGTPVPPQDSSNRT